MLGSQRREDEPSAAPKPGVGWAALGAELHPTSQLCIRQRLELWTHRCRSRGLYFHGVLTFQVVVGQARRPERAIKIQKTIHTTQAKSQINHTGLHSGGIPGHCPEVWGSGRGAGKTLERSWAWRWRHHCWREGRHWPHSSGRWKLGKSRDVNLLCSLRCPQHIVDTQ